MAYNGNLRTSIHGRRLGLNAVSSAESGGNHGTREFLAGPDAFRVENSTSESTSTNLKPFGVSHALGTSADSSSVFTLDPPIPGVEKTLYFPSTGDTACYVKTANSETIHSTIGSSHTVIKSTLGGMCRLMGVTTGVWAAIGLTSGTSSQAGGFSLTTST